MLASAICRPMSVHPEGTSCTSPPMSLQRAASRTYGQPQAIAISNSPVYMCVVCVYVCEL